LACLAIFSGALVSAPATQAQAEKATSDPVSVILARPLFEQSRRADVAATAADQMPVLTGIVRNADVQVAIFRGSGVNDTMISVAVGGKIQGWSLVALTPDTASLTRAGTRLALHPDYRGAPFVGGVTALPTAAAN